FFFQAEDGIRDRNVTGVQTCALPIYADFDFGASVQREMARPYVEDLKNVIDMELIRSAKIKIGVDPLGGAAIRYWDVVSEPYGLNITVVNRQLDPKFAFMTFDHDAKISMDCSSAYAMARLVGLKDQ